VISKLPDNKVTLKPQQQVMATVLKTYSSFFYRCLVSIAAVLLFSSTLQAQLYNGSLRHGSWHTKHIYT